MTIKKYLDLLRKNGYKTTKRRKDILAFFDQSRGYRTAKNLLEFLERKYFGISFDTVYRNLHLFHELGILEVTELNGEKHFRIACSPKHHHHFICNDCGTTKKISNCPMDEIEEDLANYQIEGHKFEIFGRCPLCVS